MQSGILTFPEASVTPVNIVGHAGAVAAFIPIAASGEVTETSVNVTV